MQRAPVARERARIREFLTLIIINSDTRTHTGACYTEDVRALLLVVLAGCGSSAAPPKPPPAPPVPIAIDTRTCMDAAIGLERSTKNIRPPESDVIGPLRSRCTDDGWPPAAIECFAGMKEDDLTRCSRNLPATQREKLLATLLGNSSTDAEELAEIVTKLQALQVGILNCDRFVQAVTVTMSCRGLASAARIQLGNETADFWSLPTTRLSIEDRARMAAACGESLQALQQQSVDVGCMP